ncbi:uncharacterized protein LOC129913357 [Episyrphus balteatus]|uniref:uncharacterized protein LOC129913357 n=1 Tax=Episyrphus balteatus TaxID=286459 RepID=UPI0024853B83|nr:uncharacterized protein LOC129913357 [Episyrphus balteatus]
MDQDLLKDESKLGKKLSLNFADKDEKENAKFNDARLVDILRNYPLLYNKSLESYGDPDYTQWMWGEIANEMNEPHRKTTLNLPFNWTTCRDQWEVVKKSLRYLSNPAAKSFRYPKQFRECLDFFQNYIRDRSEPTHTDTSQDLFLNFSTLLEQLPFEKQLLLEKEVLDLILSNELEFCAPMIDPDAVEAHAREEFGKVIGLLMPEVDVKTVHNELATEPDTELNLFDEIIQKPEENTFNEKPVIFSTQPSAAVIDAKPGIELNRVVTQYDFKNFIRVPSETAVAMEVPELQNNVHYSIQEVSGVEDIIEEDGGMEDDNIQPDTDNTQEQLVMQECVFQEDDFMQEEDLIEEVISEGGGKDMPALNISESFEVPVSRLDFDGVLNEMLE